MGDKNDICPICGAKPKLNDTSYSEGIVCELHIECKRCGYNYDFAYGAACVSFAGLEWQWGYQMEASDRVAFDESLALQRAYSIFWQTINSVERVHTSYLEKERAKDNAGLSEHKVSKLWDNHFSDSSVISADGKSVKRVHRKRSRNGAREAAERTTTSTGGGGTA